MRLINEEEREKLMARNVELSQELSEYFKKHANINGIIVTKNPKFIKLINELAANNKKLGLTS